MQVKRLLSLMIILLSVVSTSVYAASISGTITDANTGQGIDMATVVALGNNPQTGDSLVYTTHTQPNGAYSLDSMQAAAYIVIVNHPQYYRGQKGPFVLDLQTNLTVDFQLVATSALNNLVSGTILDAQTLAPVPRANVRLLDQDLVHSTVSDSVGIYRFEDISPGGYQLGVDALGYLPFVGNLLIFISPDTQITDLDIHLIPDTTGGSGVLTGTVRDSISQLPVYPAFIELTGILSSGDTLRFFADNNPDGTYRLDNLIAGDYTVECSAVGFETATINHFPITPAGNVLDFYLLPLPNGNGTLMGRVLDSAGNSSVNPAFIELANMDSTTGDSLIFRTVNQPDGRYIIRNIIPGTYSLSCTAIGYHPVHINGFIINEGQNAHDFLLTAMPPQGVGAISGTAAFDSSGNPVVGATLEFISNMGFGYSTQTDSSGNYSALIPAGDYIVSVTYIGPAIPFIYQEYYDDVHTISEATMVTVVENGTTSGIDFGIPESISQVVNATISGTVTDNNGMPLDSAMVRILGANFGSPVGDSLLFTGVTDAQGNYSIGVHTTVFPNASFIASAEEPSYKIEFWQEKPAMLLADPIFIVRDTVITGIDFTLDPGGTPSNNSISGTVSSDTSSAGMSDAFIVGSNMITGEIVFTFSNARGQYTLDGLEQAPYILLFAAGGHVPEFYDNVLAWEDATPVFASSAIISINAGLAPLNSNPTGGNIAGIINDDLGNPISGVFLTIRNSARDVIGYDFSDSQGGYQVAGIVNGDYTVQASKVRYDSKAEQVQYNSNNVNTMVVNFTLQQTVVGITPGEDDNLPQKIELAQNYPNPFNPTTVISWQLAVGSHVELEIYNLLGQKIRTLLSAKQSPGFYQVAWDGEDDAGRQVASGVYIYRIKADKFIRSKKMLLLR
jgi:protocatechuate 3,4-dioxygenase beta subunit